MNQPEPEPDPIDKGGEWPPGIHVYDLSDRPAGLRYDPGQPTDPPIAPYTQPAVTVSVTWAATDGSKPEQVTVEWKNPPPVDDVINVADAVIQAGYAAYDNAAYSNTQQVPAVTIQNSPSQLDLDQEAADALSRAVGHHGGEDACPARLDLGRPGAHNHRCALPTGHDPVEPDGRQHRCVCGGLFATDREMPAVPGQAAQKRRLERER